MLRCLLPFVLVACDSPATQLVVVVDTDFEVNEELATLAVATMDAEGRQVSAHELALADDGEEPSPAQFAMPLSFGVVPLGGDASRRVTVQVDGRGSDGALRVRRTAVTGFIEGQRLMLPMFLARSCRDVFCEEGETCSDGTCVGAAVPPSTLRVVRPGDELRFDAGIAPPTDGGPDADAAIACDEVLSCDGACSGCATDCCTLECVSSPCAPRCTPTNTCRIEAPAGGDVDVTCDANTTCEVHCATATSCDVSCRGGCVVHCPDTGCTVSDCTAAELRECAGDVVTCRAECP